MRQKQSRDQYTGLIEGGGGRGWNLQREKLRKSRRRCSLGTIGGCAVLGVGWRYMYLEPRRAAGIGVLRWRW